MASFLRREDQSAPLLGTGAGGTAGQPHAMTMSQQIGLLSQWEFWLFLTLGVATTCAAFYLGFRYLYLSRLIENLPTSSIQHSQQGYVELQGIAQTLASTPIKGPLSGADCCWYRYRIEKRRGRNWRTVRKGESEARFRLRDPTGDCIVDPKGAKVYTEDRDVWYGTYPQRTAPGSQESPASLLGRLQHTLVTEMGLGAPYRYQEARIREGETLYTVGHFRTLDEIDLKQRREQSQVALLRTWKDDQNGLLARFDANRNGRIDQQEWELARQAALRKSVLQQREQHLTQVPHTLSGRGPGLRPFLISTQPEFALTQHYRRRAVLAISVFFTLGVTTLWMLANRPGP